MLPISCIRLMTSLSVAYWWVRQDFFGVSSLFFCQSRLKSRGQKTEGLVDCGLSSVYSRGEKKNNANSND